MIITRGILSKKEKTMQINPDKPEWPDGLSITPIPNEERQCAILEAIFACLAAMLEELKRMNAEKSKNPA